jgi:hypothetical protein
MAAIEKLVAGVDALHEQHIQTSTLAPNRRPLEDSPTPITDPFKVFEDDPQETASRNRRRREMVAANPSQLSPARAVTSPQPPRTPSTFDIVQGTPTPARQRESISVMVPTPSDTGRMAPC